MRRGIMKLRTDVGPFRILLWAAAPLLFTGASCPTQTSTTTAPPALEVIGFKRGNGVDATMYIETYSGKRFEGVLPSSSVRVMITPLPLETGFDVAIDGVAVPRVTMDELRGDSAQWGLEYNIGTPPTTDTETLVIMPPAAKRRTEFVLTITARRADLVSSPRQFNIGLFGYQPYPLTHAYSATSGTKPATASPTDAGPTAGPCGADTPGGREVEYSFDQKCGTTAFPPIPSSGCTREEARHRARLLLQYNCYLTEIEGKYPIASPPDAGTPCTTTSFRFCVSCDDGSHSPQSSSVSADGCKKDEARAKIAGGRPYFCTIKDEMCPP